MSPSLLYQSDAQAGQKLPVSKKGVFLTQEKPTLYKGVVTYNNFYEFSTDKEGVAYIARNFKIRPWIVSVEGLVKKSKVNDRVYRSIVDLGEKVIDGDTVTILIPFDGGALGGKTFRLHE